MSRPKIPGLRRRKDVCLTINPAVLETARKEANRLRISLSAYTERKLTQPEP